MRPETLLAFRIKSLNNQIGRHFERTAISENSANLTGMQYAVLGFINENGQDKEIYQRDIEGEFNIRRSTASEMLQLLEKKGFIGRESVADDARLKKIVLTKEGRELEAIAKTNAQRLQDRLTIGLSEEELRQFYLIMDKIQKNMEE